MRNLSRDEATVRAALLAVDRYDVHLDLRPALAEPAFDSTVEVRFSCRTPGAGTFVELDGRALQVRLNGRQVPAGEGNRITLDDLAADNVLQVRARCATSRTGEGMHRFVDPADGAVYLYVQSFLDDCQRVFACFDQPDLKAVVRLVVDAPPEWEVVANARGERDGDRWTFAPTERISTYLFSVAAGPYTGVRRWHDGVELGLHCRRSLAGHLDADELFGVTAQAFDLQHALFGHRYPFGDTYDQLFVPEFNAGAMENPGAVTFTEDFVFRSRVTQGARRMRAVVVAHELSHQWFGNLVTMRWWDDLWLNESFAELMGFLTADRATRFEDTWVDFCATRKAWGYRADALPTTHPVAGSAQDNRSALLDFDGISYAKGASVLRQLMATIGEEAFLAGVRDHLARHAFGNATFADLLGAFERAGGRDLQDWAQRWLRTPGTSTLRVVRDGGTRVVQEPPADHPVLREHRLGVGLYGADGTRRHRQDVVVVDAVDVADAPLVLPNDDDRTFARVALDGASTDVLLGCLSRIADPLARAVAWSSLWASVRDAELAPDRFVAGVLAHVGGERDPGVVTTLLQQARTVAALYAADGAPLLERLARSGHDAAVGGEPGSDLQLVHLRAFVSAAGTDRVPALRALLDGAEVPPGVVVDAELRWLLVQRLCALGADVDLDAERERDRTATGLLSALTARAARPDVDGKAAAFAEATSGALSSHEAQALAEGLFVPGQDEVTRPLVPRYAEAVPRLWERSPAEAQALTRALFPATLPDEETVAVVDALLAGDLAPGARRVVVEQRHDLRRAVAARRRYPARG